VARIGRAMACWKKSAWGEKQAMHVVMIYVYYVLPCGHEWEYEMTNAVYHQSIPPFPGVQRTLRSLTVLVRLLRYCYPLQVVLILVRDEVAAECISSSSKPQHEA
jgi:hypothetical protein